MADFYPSRYEAGSVGYADRVTGRVIIENTGTGALHIENVRSNCSCYRVSLSRETLQAGESASLDFDLTFPKDKKPRNAFFYVLSDDVKQRLRVFMVKLSVNKDPTFSIARPKELILQSSDKEKQDASALEELNSRFGVVEVQERSVAGDKKRYALRFDDGVDLEAAAKEYVKHPAVGLAFLGAPEAKPSVSEKGMPVALQQFPKAPTPPSAARKRVTPLSVYWFYSEGCAFCDDVKSLMARMSSRYGSNIAVKPHEISKLANYEKLISLEEKFDVRKNDPMVVFLGKAFLSGYRDILRGLDGTIHEQLALGSPDISLPSPGDSAIGSGRPAAFFNFFWEKSPNFAYIELEVMIVCALGGREGRG